MKNISSNCAKHFSYQIWWYHKSHWKEGFSVDRSQWFLNWG